GNRLSALIQAQLGFACLRVRAVTLKTIPRQDRPDVAIERHLSPGRLVRGKGRQLGQGHQQQGGENGSAHKGSSFLRQYPPLGFRTRLLYLSVRAWHAELPSRGARQAWKASDLSSYLTLFFLDFLSEID